MNTKRSVLVAMFAISQLMSSSLHAYDILVEGKGNAFISTNNTYKNIYGRATGGGGFEMTAGAYRNLYGFFSVDGFRKSGNTECFCSPTTAKFLEIGLGLKYFVPFSCGDFYLGLGALPTWLKTNDCAPYVISEQSHWGCGGIAKVGVYFNLPKSFIVDIFANYSFVKIKGECCPNIGTIPNTAHLNGVILGVGLGYRWDTTNN
jgi:hypothetical protein